MERGRANRVKGNFKMKGNPMQRNFGISPLKDTEIEAGKKHQHPHTEAEQEVIDESESSAGNILIPGGTSEIGTMGDDARKAKEERDRLKKEHEQNALNRTKTVIDPKTGKEILVSTDSEEDGKYKTGGDLIEPKEWYNKKAFKETGIGHITDAVRSIARGIKKKKAKKAKRVEEAKTAESEGTETLKQAKLVKRAKKKEDRALKRKIKNQKKLKKFREKNPVTGKEAIKLATGSSGKSLV